MHLNEQPAKERPINMLLRACRSSADKRKIIPKPILPPCVHGRTLCMHLNSHQWDHLHSASHHHFQLFQPPHLICMQSLFSMFHLGQPRNRGRAHLIGAIFWGLFHIDLEIYQEKKLLTFWFIFHPQSFAGQEVSWFWCGMSPNLGFGTNAIICIILIIIIIIIIILFLLSSLSSLSSG